MLSYADAVRESQLLGGEFARHRGQSFCGSTGTMAAALASGGAMFVARYPAAATGLFMPAVLHVHYTCLANFTTPVTAGRRLALHRGSGADPSGGSSIEVVPDISDAYLQSITGIGSVEAQQLLTGKVATTAALTVTSITFDTPSRARMSLAHAGLAGQDYDELWVLNGFALGPGELFGIRAGQAFDAGGTWQASVKGWGYSVPG